MYLSCKEKSLTSNTNSFASKKFAKAFASAIYIYIYIYMKIYNIVQVNSEQHTWSRFIYRFHSHQRHIQRLQKGQIE